MRRRLALIGLVAVLASGCGDDSVPVEDYADDVCGALTGWGDALRERQAELQDDAGSGQTPEEDRAALQRFVDGAVEASDGLVDDVESAGTPDIDGGEDAADAIRDAVEQARAELEEAQDAVGEIPTDSRGAYRSAVEALVMEVRGAFQRIEGQFADVDAPGLDAALDEASACQA